MWKWKSDLRKRGDTDDCWTPFTQEECDKIEKAHQRGQASVKLNDKYKIDFKKMLQMRHDDPSRQRPIMRADPAARVADDDQPQKKKAKAEGQAGSPYSELAQALLDALPVPLPEAQCSQYLAEMKLAGTDPRKYVQEHVEEINRDVYDEDELVPWLALPRGLEARSRAFGLDNKFGIDQSESSIQCSMFVADALEEPNGESLWKRKEWIDEDDEDDATPHEYLGPVANALYKERKVTLLIFDVDSDDYTLVPVRSSAVGRLKKLAEAAGHAFTDARELDE